VCVDKTKFMVMYQDLTAGCNYNTKIENIFFGIV
jgi:hypothetical protein